MIQQLCIDDFIIIEHLILDFDAGLSVITGETGAGKSIMLAALNLLLGGRADSSVIRPGAKQARLSVRFGLNPLAKTWLQQHDFPTDRCELQRTIGLKGRSRAYINAKLANLGLLAALGEHLLDIHSQHAHQALLKMEQQRRLLDAMVNPNPAYSAMFAVWKTWQDLQQQRKALGGDKAQRENRMTLLRYQIEELETLLSACGDLDQLEANHQRLAHAEQLQTQAQQVLAALQDEVSGQGALSLLHQAQKDLSQMQAHDDNIVETVDLIEQAAINADEAFAELNRYLSQLVLDPDRYALLDQQLAQLQDLARKHQCRVEKLPPLLKDLSAQLQELENAEHTAAQLDIAEQDCLARYHKLALQLSLQRQKSAKTLAAAISQRIKSLGMVQGQLAIEVVYHAAALPSQHGADEVNFLVSTNLKQPLRPLNKVASGGELSRISLAIQVILSQGNGVDCLIFDEVDVGVGGAVAEVIGQQLADLSQQRQVICITHLAQVAAYGRQHFLVEKLNQQDQTISCVQVLNSQQRVEELARMSGGIERTAESLAHARSLLADSAAYQQGVSGATA